MPTKLRIFKCTGCGESRPCFYERNQEAHELDGIIFTSDNLKCIADETNATGYKWEEIDIIDRFEFYEKNMEKQFTMSRVKMYKIKRFEK